MCFPIEHGFCSQIAWLFELLGFDRFDVVFDCSGLHGWKGLDADPVLKQDSYDPNNKPQS